MESCQDFNKNHIDILIIYVNIKFIKCIYINIQRYIIDTYIIVLYIYIYIYRIYIYIYIYTQNIHIYIYTHTHREWSCLTYLLLSQVGQYKFEEQRR